VDDIRPLEKLAADTVKADFALFDIKPATLFSFRSTTDMWSDPGFAGPNSPFGVAISYYLNPGMAKDAKVKLTIFDKDGKDVNTIRATKDPGLNRVYWSLRESPGPRAGEAQEMMMRGMGGGSRRMAAFFGGGFGPWTLPGEYKAVLDVNGQKAEKMFTVKEDPLSGISLEDRKLNQKYFREASDLTQKGMGLLRTLDLLGKSLPDVESAVKSMKEPDKALLEKVAAVREKVDGVKKVYALSTEEQSMYRKPLKTAYRGGTVAELIMSLASGISRTMGAPTQTTIDQIQDLRSFLTPLLDRMKEVTEKDIPELNKALAEKGVPYIKL
jgi:hypothetical protein